MHMCYTFIFRYTYAYLASESRYAPQAGGAQISLDLNLYFTQLTPSGSRYTTLAGGSRWSTNFT